MLEESPVRLKLVEAVVAVVHVDAVASLYCTVYKLVLGAAAQLNVAELAVMLFVANDTGGLASVPAVIQDAFCTRLRNKFPGCVPKPLLKLIPVLVV